MIYTGLWFKEKAISISIKKYFLRIPWLLVMRFIQ
jgi:hypothetical protein